MISKVEIFICDIFGEEILGVNGLKSRRLVEHNNCFRQEDIFVDVDGKVERVLVYIFYFDFVFSVSLFIFDIFAVSSSFVFGENFTTGVVGLRYCHL